MALNQAERHVNPLGYTIRLVEVDGQGLMVTMDYNPQRINVRSRNGRVMQVVNLG